MMAATVGSTGRRGKGDGGSGAVAARSPRPAARPRRYVGDQVAGASRRNRSTAAWCTAPPPASCATTRPGAEDQF